ncbi:MAG: hypothetical protein IJD02_01545 [Lachnospiraceae bacterium]|nr:hypothetical protein [Lachnospiraceae bacterium]
MDYYDVDGFRFFDKEEYENALKDKETIDYINKRFDFSNTKSVLGLYYKMVEENTFKTVIGYAYLKRIYDVLVKVPGIKKDTLPVIIMSDSDRIVRITKRNNKSYERRIEKLDGQVGTYKIVIAFMIAIIISMFVITLNNDSLNYNNAYNAVVDEYEAWEKELQEKEKELEEKEKELEELENQK